MKDLSKKLITMVTNQAVSGYEWYLGMPQTIQSLTSKKSIRIGDNLVFCVGSGQKKVLISAHMDEVGFFISKIEKNFVRIMPIGDIDITDCIGTMLVFDNNGQKQKTKALGKALSFSQLKVYGIRNPQVGMVGTFEKNITDTDEIIGPSLDNKVGCLVLLEVLNAISKDTKDKTFIFCFACREEVSLNGLMRAVREINPDVCIDIDSAYALPVSSPAKKKNWQVPTLGKGPAIQLMGSGFIIRSDDRFLVEKVAQESNIPFQYEIPDAENGGTNASTLIANGYDTIQINIPVANQHSAESKASLSDIEQTITLLKNVLIAL